MDISRRRLLLSAAGVLTQTMLGTPSVAEPLLIEGSEASGTGFGYPEAAQHRNAQQSTSLHAPQSDWRHLLLNRERFLWLRRDATGESTKLVYWRPDSGYVRDGYSEACKIMRDVRANKVAFMDPVLLDLLCGMQGWLMHYGYVKPIVVLSGFRSAETNSRTEGAARNSKHLSGQAVDLVIPGISQATIGQMAIMFNNGERGGVGFYPNNGFVHIDTGTARTWVTQNVHRSSHHR